MSEAIQTQEALARVSPVAHGHALGVSLNNRAGCYVALGRTADARADLERAVAIGQSLGEDEGRLEQGLLVWLRNLRRVLRDCGTPQDVLAVSHHFVDTLRIHARESVERESELAIVLMEICDEQHAQGDDRAALLLVDEALTLLRRMSHQNERRFAGELAAGLNRRSGVLLSLNRRPDALACVRDAVALYRELSQRYPGVLPFLEGLATALRNEAIVHGTLDDNESAIGCLRDAIAVRETLATIRPGGAIALGRCLRHLVACLMHAGRTREAHEAARDAVVVTTPTALALLADVRSGGGRVGIAAAEPLVEIVSAYVRVCTDAEKEPERALLRPFVQLLQALPAAPLPTE